MKLYISKNRLSAIRVVFLTLIILIAHSNGVKAADDDIIIGKTETISSKILDEERSMQVYLPPNYEIGSESYPVLYLLDGRTHFLHGSGIVEYLSRLGLIPQMIVVAISNVDRTRDFSPTHIEDRPTTGGAGKFLSFLDDELIPHIDKKFRTMDFNVLMGHSFGGTFAVHSLLTNPELFNGYIAISPYLHYDDSYLVNQAATKLKSAYKTHKFFYMTVGNEPNYFEPLKKFSSLIDAKSGNAIDFEYTIMEAENHGSIPHLSIYNGLKFIFSEWQLPRESYNEGLSAVDEHYTKLSEKYGVKVNTPEVTINILGYTYLQNADNENAIRVFKENIKRYPQSANVYDSLGEAYENDDQLDKAGTNYQKAYELGLSQNHPNTEVFETNLKRVKKK